MQQVAELVEDRLHFAMRQQRRLVSDRRREIAADQAQVRLEAVGVGPPVMKRIHPGAAALVLARIPVGIKAAQQRRRPRRRTS